MERYRTGVEIVDNARLPALGIRIVLRVARLMLFAKVQNKELGPQGSL